MTRYATDVVAGRYVVGKLVRLACERHLRDLSRQRTKDFPFYFDEERAERAIGFFRFLKHSKGEWAGQPLELEAWQAFIVGSLFGWLRLGDDTRRFRIALAELARKNGKSTLAAGIGLLLAFFDGEGGAEVYAAATKRDQAKIVWGEAKRMVEKSPSLKQRITVLQNNLHILGTASKFEPLGADQDTTDGLNIHGAIVDELHAHKTRSMVDVLETATGARRQSLIFYITTAGTDRHSVCYEKHDYAIKVLEGVFEDETFFAYIACLDEDDDYTDPANWPKANPNLHVSVKYDDLEMKCERAKQVPGQQNAFKRLHCGVWTEQADRWLDIANFDENAGPFAVEELREQLAGKPCYAGLDLSSKVDLTSLMLRFKAGAFEDDETAVGLLSFNWLPEENAPKRAEQDRVPYPLWAEQGYITLTEGNVIDQAFIRQTLNELGGEFEILEVGYDPFNATQLATELQQDGFTVVPIRQGFMTLSEPTKNVEALLLSHKVRHGGNPVLRWAASNVAVEQDPAGNLKPSKKKSTERIDPVAAWVTAEARAIVHQATPGSVYDSDARDDGFLTI